MKLPSIDTWGANSPRQVDSTALSDLANSFGAAADIVSSKQRALEIALDSLDAAQYGTAVIMPVVAPEWVLSAVLRSRCQPVLIDAGGFNVCMSTNILKEAIADLGKLPCAVLHLSAFGEEISKEALEATEELITFTITPNLPHSNTSTTFSIFDLCPAMTKGALLATNFADMHSLVRASIERSGDYVSPYEATIAKKFFAREAERKAELASVAKVYDAECRSRKITYCLHPDLVVRYYPILVSNAAYMQACLRGNNIDSVLEMNSLAELPYVKKSVTKEFPIATVSTNRVLSLPTNIKPQLVPFILDLVKEVEERNR